MTCAEAIQRADRLGIGAWHICKYGYEAPYAEFDAKDWARAAFRAASIALASTEVGLIVEGVTGNVREGRASECRFGERHIAPAPCESIARPVQRDERQESRNRLRVDAMQPGLARCLNMAPPRIDAIRWIGSGGGVEVFGLCVGRGNPKCPLNL